MYTVLDRSGPTLLPIIQQVIAPGTTIISDIWAAYGVINAMGFGHLQVSHTCSFVDPQTGAYNTQNIENSWKNAKQQKAAQYSSHDSWKFSLRMDMVTTFQKCGSFSPDPEWYRYPFPSSVIVADIFYSCHITPRFCFKLKHFFVVIVVRLYPFTRKIIYFVDILISFFLLDPH